ncbi:hypothetical protein ACOI1H_20030 [Loktanella sp. DJP18]|uniref:hypothetical protein n=1 Tax=Loktanella sp. DJP18 TaxID=3409788 RepID=UPI003BB652DF
MVKPGWPATPYGFRITHGTKTISILKDVHHLAYFASHILEDTNYDFTLRLGGVWVNTGSSFAAFVDRLENDYARILRILGERAETVKTFEALVSAMNHVRSAHGRLAGVVWIASHDPVQTIEDWT